MLVHELIERLKRIYNQDVEVVFLDCYDGMTEQPITGILFDNSGVTLTNEDNR